MAKKSIMSCSLSIVLTGEIGGSSGTNALLATEDEASSEVLALVLKEVRSLLFDETS